MIHRGFTSAVIVSVMVEEKGKQAKREKQGRKPWTLRELGGKTLWDWLQLLIVPLVLSLITVAFALWQDTRQDRVETQRAKAERKLAEQRAQDEALQAYLDQMSTLMLEKDLRKSDENSEVRTLARARTLTALRRVDTSRKEEIMQFLLEANLLQGEYVVVQAESGPVLLAPVLQLHQAPLGETDLSEASLVGANLSRANLSRANLSRADLRDAEMYQANLSEANLIHADLRDAFLTEANLSEANLSEANLRLADLRSFTSLGGANLSEANLSGAKLNDDTVLEGANLSGVNLSDAQVTNQQLEAAKSLKGATMPNGQKYEDWLKRNK